MLARAPATAAHDRRRRVARAILSVAAAVVASAVVPPSGPTRADDGDPLPRSFTVGVKAVVPPDHVTIDRNIALNERHPFDPDHEPGTEIEYEKKVRANPGYEIINAGLQVRLLTGLSRYSSKIADDRRSVTVEYAVRNGDGPEAPPAVIDAWITITQEKFGDSGSEALILQPIKISRIGNYPLYPDPKHLQGRTPFRIDYMLVDKNSEPLGTIKLHEPLIVDGVEFRIDLKGERRLVMRVAPAG